MRSARADPELSAVCDRNRVDEGQAEDGTAGGTRLVALTEALGRVHDEGRVDGTFVADRHHDVGVVAPRDGGERDVAAAVTDRVLGEVSECALEKHPVTFEKDLRAIGMDGPLVRLQLCACAGGRMSE